MSLRACVILLGVITAACGSGPTGPTSFGSTEALVTALRAQGATAATGQTLPKDPGFFSTGARLVTVNSGIVSVYEYDNSRDADRDAATVLPDGSSIGSTMVLWVGPPHFFKNGRLIVLYAGDNSDVLQPLTTVLGAQFSPR
ncbi:MAG TPA: hypothetical protein VJM31_19095 [Vicinamibacterales bacterium]|nr:hypothetical protein [Vicinamibacterales bacterium]